MSITWAARYSTWGLWDLWYQGLVEETREAMVGRVIHPWR
jgi:hypothetical protein